MATAIQMIFSRFSNLGSRRCFGADLIERILLYPRGGDIRILLQKLKHNCSLPLGCRAKGI